MLKIDYIELLSGDMKATQDFLTQAFGWSFQDYGPTYQAFADAGIDGGIDGSGEGATGVPLVILKTDDLEAALQQVTDAGAEITQAIFSFPGGRRFQFREPGGNEMGVWSES